MLTESHPDVPSVPCQGEKSYLELLRPGDLLPTVIIKVAVPLWFTNLKYAKWAYCLKTFNQCVWPQRLPSYLFHNELKRHVFPMKRFVVTIFWFMINKLKMWRLPLTLAERWTGQWPLTMVPARWAPQCGGHAAEPGSFRPKNFFFLVSCTCVVNRT